MSGSQTPVTQQTTQTRDPWTAAQPHLTGIMNQADQTFAGVEPAIGGFGGPGYIPYSGQTQAAPDINFSTALAAQSGMAGSELGGNAGVLAGMDLGTNMIQNQGLNSGLLALLQQQQGQNNPYLEGTIRQGVNQANAAASGMGRYGSGAHDAAITQAMAPILSADYARRQGMQQDILQGGLQRAGQWAQLMPTLDQAKYQPAQIMQGIGDIQNARNQAQLNDQIKLYNAQQAYPWEQLQRYNALIGGAGALGGTQITSSPIQQPSTLQSTLGGAAAGAGIGSIFGLPGAAVGAGAGGLLGLLK